MSLPVQSTVRECSWLVHLLSFRVRLVPLCSPESGCICLTHLLPCPDLSILLCPTGRKWPLVCLLFFSVLTCPSLCAQVGKRLHLRVRVFRVSVLTFPPSCVYQNVSFFLYSLTPRFLTYPVFSLQTLIYKLTSFVADVLSLFYTSILGLLMHFQPPLSRDDTHHTMIGTFLLSAPSISNS